MTRKPTMHDVARIAGVGTMTVSRVLNGSQHVAEETAARVLRAVAKLGYHPNEMARALRNFKSRTIGLIVPSLHDTFFANCAHAVNLVAQEQHYTVLLTTSDDQAEVEFQEAQKMLQRHVEGMVVVPAGIGPSRLDDPTFRAIPVVAMDRPVKNAPIDAVVVENETGSALAVSHLIEEHGHRRILFLGFRHNLDTVQLRGNGYARAMRAAGLPLTRNFSCDSQETIARVIRTAVAGPEPPTAIFTANNLVTRDVLLSLRSLGLRVPEEMALIGFDDLELGDILHPALTVIRQPAALLGESAARLLFHRLASDRPTRNEAQHLVLPVELVLRHSCGCAYAPEVETADQLALPRKRPVPRVGSNGHAVDAQAPTAKRLQTSPSKPKAPARAIAPR